MPNDATNSLDPDDNSGPGDQTSQPDAIEYYGDEASSASSATTKKGKSFSIEVEKTVSEKDVFILGKQILLIVGAMLVAIATVKIAALGKYQENVKDVWEYAKVFLNSVASLVLGYYFGKRDK